MSLQKKRMPETMYRVSRYFRVLGNPTAYLILRSLGKKQKSPTELSEQLDIPITTISSTLRHLREVNLVRYETRSRCKVYMLKDRDVLDLLGRGEALADKMRNKVE